MSNYYKYWHISAPVFVRPADASALFLSATTSKITAELLKFTESHQSLAILSGVAGSGKTTLLRWLAQTVPMKTHDVFLMSLPGRETNSGWLLPRVASFFQQGAKQWDEVLKTGISQLSREDRHLVVCIDAAHLISSDEAISDLEAFFNLQELTEQRVSFVLSGNPDLTDRVKKNNSLTVRVSCYLMTGRMSRLELDDYVMQRLKQAGIAVIFDPEALTQIYRQCDGNFLSANMALEKCLIEAAAKESKRITPYISEQAIQTMNQNRDIIAAAANTSDRAFTVNPVAPAIPAADPIEKKTRQDQHGLLKSEPEKTGNIKLSSLFKQDDD